MNAESPTNPDALDRLLSDFFQREQKQPWPPAPVPASVEPVELVAVRNETPAPRRPLPDPGTRARLTLAVSAAVLLGGCWVLSSGLQPADRPVNTTTRPTAGPGLGGATAGDQGALPKIREDKARETKDPAAGFVPSPIRLP
jgi:hypothetical protein